MTQTKSAGLARAASRIGCTWQEYFQKKESGYKWCSACKKWVPLDWFNSDSGAIDGKDNKCKDCSRAKDRRRLQRKRQEQITNGK